MAGHALCTTNRVLWDSVSVNVQLTPKATDLTSFVPDNGPTRSLELLNDLFNLFIYKNKPLIQDALNGISHFVCLLYRVS